MALPTTLTNVTTRKLASTISNLWTKIAANFLKPVSGTIQLSSNTTTKIGTLNGTDVNLQMPTIPAAANNGKLNLQVNTGTATQLFTANQSGNSTLTLKQGSNASLSVSSNTVTIAATDTKNTVGVGAVSSHEYGAYYYVPCVSGYQSSATNAQSYTEAGSTSLLAITEDPVAGWMANVGTSFMGLFASRPTSSMEGKIVTVNMDGILEVSSVATDSVALAANVEPLLTTTRGVDKVKINPQQSGETNMRIAGFAATSSTGGTNNYGIWLGNGSGSLTYNNSYIISKIDPSASSSYGQAHKFSGLSQYAITANSATSATTANKVGNSLTLTIKSGTTEGTDKYTFNGSAGKTLNFAAGSNISLTAGTNSLTIAATNTKNTVGTGAATHTYDKYYYVPFTTSTQSAASNAQSYTELTGEMETRTPLLRFVDDPVKGMQGFIAGNQIGRFNGVPPETADGKLVTVGMDGQLIVSSILETDVALSSNVEPLLTVGRKVIKTGSTGGWDEAAPEPNGEILGFNCSKTASNNRDGFGIALNVNGTMTGGLTFTETVNGTKSTSYILAYAHGAITGGKKFHFYGSSDYAITAGTAVSAGSAGSATNVALTGSVKTTSTSNGDTIQFQAGSGTAGTVTIVNAKHAASADSATSASYLKDATNTSRTAKVSYYGSGAISGSNAVQYLAGFYTPDGSSSSTICDVPHAKMLMYIFGQLYSSRCTTINSNHTLSLSDFSNNAEGSLYMYQNVTAASKTLTWTYRHTQGLGTATGTVEKGCTAVFILDDATNAVFTRIM